VIDAAARPRRGERVLAQHADAETMLLDLDGGTYFALNEVGARIWELCDGSRTAADIAGVLAVEYEAGIDMITEDVLTLLTELQAEELVALE